MSYAITINKSQGQSLDTVGIYLSGDVFTHGQIYVAISRVTTKKGIKILIHDDNYKLKSTIVNVAYKEVFNNIRMITYYGMTLLSFEWYDNVTLLLSLGSFDTSIYNIILHYVSEIGYIQSMWSQTCCSCFASKDTATNLTYYTFHTAYIPYDNYKIGRCSLNLSACIFISTFVNNHIPF